MLPEHLQTLSIETFLLDCEDKDTSIERANNEFADGITVANQEATKPSTTSPINTQNTVQTPGVSEFMAEEKITIFGDVDISSLFVVELNENEPLLNENSNSSTLFNLATTPEISLIQNSDFDSGNETFALDSLFDESETTPVLSASAELEFYDLFDAPEESQASLNLLKELTTISVTEDAYLFDFLGEEPEAASQTEVESEEFCFSLETGENLVDEFPATETFTLSLTESEATTTTDSDISIGDSLSNTDEFSTTLFQTLQDLSVNISTVETFDDLEKLLEETPAATTVVGIAPQQAEIDEFSQLEALLAQDPPAVAPVTQAVDDEFDDLEKLLEETPAATTVADIAQQEAEIDEFSQLEALLDPEPPAIAPVTQAVVPSTDKTSNGSPTFKPNQVQAAASNAHRPALEQTMRVPVKHLDNVNNLVGELVVNRNSLEQDQQRLRQSLDNLLHQVQQLNGLGSRMQELYERSLMEASLINIRQGSQSALLDQAAASSERHATGMDFDALEMDRFTGFHTLSQEMIELLVRVREASSDIEFVTDETEQVARQFRQVTTQLQEGLTRSRMVPFGEIADRLPRAVRDISLKYGKQVELHIEGRETLIDKMLLQQLYDPMTHLVNNSITHGIETPDERTAKGKPPIGKITIRAFYQGNQTVIAVSDDGAGIDTDRVITKAIQKGLITMAEARTMSRLDTYNLLFHPGFSMKDHADQYAGRGVGMDVVRTSLSEIRGTISTDSTLGKGTTFTIRLPLTLSICKALCCVSEKAQMAFPMDGVEDMMEIPTANVLLNDEGQSCISWRDSLLPFRPLKELLTYNRQLGRGNVYGINREDDMISIVVLRSAGTFMAIQVDQVLGEQEIVIKQFEAPAPKPMGVAGATVMGDGRIMPIADVLELIDLARGRSERESSASSLWAATPVMPEIADVKTEPMVLIVDDSITVRELLSMTFNKAGYRVEQARDGQEAWDKLRDGLPCDLVFCDIEMPRMDGLELLSRMQKDPNLSQLPIAMLTSRGADRHRQMAIQLGARGYFTKPYLEEALLDGAQKMLNGEVLVASSSNV